MVLRTPKKSFNSQPFSGHSAEVAARSGHLRQGTAGTLLRKPATNQGDHKPTAGASVGDRDPGEEVLAEGPGGLSRMGPTSGH